MLLSPTYRIIDFLYIVLDFLGTRFYYFICLTKIKTGSRPMICLCLGLDPSVGGGGYKRAVCKHVFVTWPVLSSCALQQKWHWSCPLACWPVISPTGGAAW